MSSSKCAKLVLVLSVLLFTWADGQSQWWRPRRGGGEHDGSVREEGEKDFVVKMEDGGRLSGRLSTNSGGKHIGLVFSASGAEGQSPSIKTLEGKVILSPLTVLQASNCRVLQVVQSTFVDCTYKGGRHFRALARQTLSEEMYPPTHRSDSGTFIHTQEESDRLFHEAVREILRMPEAHLLPLMSQKLGRSGFHGDTSSPALKLHITAQRFSALLPGSSGLDVTVASKLSVASMKACSLDKACPPCKDKGCTGMCGPGCSCWRWVCGDCCYHKGCLDHDICCTEKGMASWACLVPLGLECNKTYKC